MIWDIIRVIDLGLAAVTLVLMAIHGIQLWKHAYTAKIRILWMGCFGAVLFIAEAVLEDLLAGKEAGFDVLFGTEVLLLMLIGAMTPFENYQIARRD